MSPVTFRLSLPYVLGMRSGVTLMYSFLLMLVIRPATVCDVALLRTLIRELAEFECELDLCVIEVAALARDDFGPNPKFRALIAKWTASLLATPFSTNTIQVGLASDFILKMYLFVGNFGVKESEYHYSPQSRKLLCKKSGTQCDGKFSTATTTRSHFTGPGELNSSTSGNPCYLPMTL